MVGRAWEEGTTHDGREAREAMMAGGASEEIQAGGDRWEPRE